MLGLFPPGPEFSLFFVTAFVIGVAPGPGMLYAIARSLGQGKAAALVSVLGLSTGSFLNCLAAALGLAALLAVSPAATLALRYAGASYMLYLAWRIARGPGGLAASRLNDRKRLAAVYGQAVITSILNPKSALFYLAFLPQFTDPARGPLLLQFILLGAIFNVMGNCINLVVALFFGQIGDWLARHPGFWVGQKWLTASLLAAVALHMLL